MREPTECIRQMNVSSGREYHLPKFYFRNYNTPTLTAYFQKIGCKHVHAERKYF